MIYPERHLNVIIFFRFSPVYKENIMNEKLTTWTEANAFKVTNKKEFID